MNTSPPNSPDIRVTLSVRALWASSLALVLIGAWLALRPDSGGDRPLLVPAAMASGERGTVVTTVGDYTLMSVESGNEDALLVLDGRREDLVVYRSDSQQAMQPSQRIDLRLAFTEARTRAGGRTPPTGEPTDRPRTNPTR